MRFVSERYPQLIVHDLRVRFVDGVADVDEPAAVEALTGLTDHGVHPADDQEPDHDTDGQDDGEPPAPPAHSASKAAWASWAAGALGIDEAGAEAMTKAELIELAEGTPDDGQPDDGQPDDE